MRLPFAVFVVLIVAASPAAQRVWVVAPVMGQGVDFTVIQDGVDAAADGDMVLVRQGTYQRFGIRAKALAVVADGPVRLVAGLALFGVEIRDLSPAQSVVVRGFELSSNVATPLAIVDCRGPVTVASSSFTARDPLSPFLVAASVAGSSEVTLIDCRMHGIGGFRGPSPGLSISDSTVHAYGCTVSGGSCPQGLRTPGAVGATVVRGFVHASRCSFVGGNGGDGVNVSGFCHPPEDGGHAVLLQDGATALWHLACGFQPGLPGSPAQGCPPGGSPGLPIAGSGTVRAMNGMATSLATAAIVRAGQTAAFDVRGPAGSGVWLGLAPRQQPLLVAACSGALHLDPATATVVSLGAMPGNGRLLLSVPVPARIAVAGVPLFAQALLADQGACQLGPPAAFLLVDSRY